MWIIEKFLLLLVTRQQGNFKRKLKGIHFGSGKQQTNPSREVVSNLVKASQSDNVYIIVKSNVLRDGLKRVDCLQDYTLKIGKYI